MRASGEATKARGVKVVTVARTAVAIAITTAVATAMAMVLGG